MHTDLDLDSSSSLISQSQLTSLFILAAHASIGQTHQSMGQR